MFAQRRQARQEAERIGQIMARLHWQCWRVDAPPVEVTDAEFIAAMPLLIRSGSVGLVWPRVRDRFAPDSAISLAMETAVASQREHNARVEREIATVVTLLRGHGIEPILVKGWAVARQYPPHLVRPAGDIDLVVRTDEFARATAILADGVGANVDLQNERRWFDRPEPGYRDRLATAVANDCPVAVLGFEDQLRVQCLHLIRHGGRRAVWLADIALTVESLPKAFDDLAILGADRVRSGWMTTILHLADRLIGAELPSPRLHRDDAAPAWLPGEMRRQWGETTPFPGEVLREVVSNPRAVVRTFRRRWPPPIRATWLLHIPFSAAPRLPVQWLAYGKLVGGYALTRLPGQLARQLDSG